MFHDGCGGPGTPTVRGLRLALTRLLFIMLQIGYCAVRACDRRRCNIDIGLRPMRDPAQAHINTTPPQENET
jgi:hypothetical protein